MGKYLRISSNIRKPSSYMTLQLLHSEFSYIWRNFDFLFYQCIRGRYWSAKIDDILIYSPLLQEYNEPHKPVRMFTYLIGREISDLEAAKWMACNNKGYFTHVTTLAEVKEQVSTRTLLSFSMFGTWLGQDQDYLGESPEWLFRYLLLL